MRVGGFSVELKRNEGSTPYTAIQGGVQNAVDPTAVWDVKEKNGDCSLMLGRLLACNPDCAVGKKCAGSNMCIDAPTNRDLGTVTVTGLGASVALEKQTNTSYSHNLTDKYPPFAPEAEVGLKSTGGAISALTLAGRGIEPLDFPGTGLMVSRNQPLPITWTASAKNKSARVHIKLDIAHHGNIAARIECDVADSGSTTIPAALVTKLMDQGLAGFPSIALTRQTVDSATVPGGCADFVVASSEERLVDVEGVISCNTQDPTCPPEDKECKACPAGMACGRDFRCK